VPNNLQANYSVEYQAEQLGFIGDIAALAANNPEIGSKLNRGLMSLITSTPGLLNDLISGGTGSPTGKGISDLVATAAIGKSSALSFLSGLAPNPRFEQLFKMVNFRKFQFNYQFAARNEKELRNIMNIIYQFKYHMHPEFLNMQSKANFLYIYPSEFDIAYYIGSEENPNLHSHTSCVLTDLNINYTPTGNFVTFDNGAPAQIDVVMQFTELAPLTKDLIEKFESPDRFAKVQ
jgi:hypothetical protein